MPRGHKHKHRNRQKKPRAQDDTQGHEESQASAAVEEEPLFLPSPVLEDISQSSPAEGPSISSQEPCRVSPIISTGIFNTQLDEDNNSQDEDYSYSSDVSYSAESSFSNSLTVMVDFLEEFILYKCKMKQLITKEDMLNFVTPAYQDQFPEIFRRASERIEVDFAVDVKEVDSVRHSYDLVSKLKLPNKGRVRAGRGLPKTGLLMILLGVIFIKGNSTTEEALWKFLNMMGVRAGRKHYIFGEPRKLITQDFVRLKYLDYRREPNSDPARYIFLWGPTAYAETSKMKVLEYWAKINQTVPSAFPKQYEEALQDEEERARARVAAKPGTTAKAKPVSRSHSADSPIVSEDQAF